MESETRVLLKELNVDLPDITADLKNFYGAFVADVKELTAPLGVKVDASQAIAQPYLDSNQKIKLFKELTQKNKAVQAQIKAKKPEAPDALERSFNDWAEKVVRCA